MNKESIIEPLLSSFDAYYDVKREGVELPFIAEAEFHSQQNGYFLIKAAKLSESDSHEFVFFSKSDRLDLVYFKECIDTAWDRGMARTNPGPGHHYSDVTLVFVTDEIEDEVLKILPKTYRQKSYRHMFWGYSNLRLIAFEPSSKRIVYNRQGASLKKLVSKLIK